jgi:hypothetical protein
MDGVTSTIQDVPVAGLIPLTLLVASGLLLWAAGRRVLRAAFAAVGLAAGAAAGWSIATGLELTIDAWIPAAILGVGVACFFVLVYRVALAGSLALVCALAAPSAVVTVAEMRGLEGPAIEAPATPEAELATEPRPTFTSTIRDTIDDASAWLYQRAGEQAAPRVFEPLTDRDDATVADGVDAAAQAAEPAVAQITDVADRFKQASRDWWDQTPEVVRPALIASAATGALAGLLLGTLAPSLTAILVSAFGGGLLWLGGLKVMAVQIGEATQALVPTTVALSVAIWLVTSLAGVAIQWTFRPKPADTAG